MIEGLHQRHYKNAIISALERLGGEAYSADVRDEMGLELTAEEEDQRDPCGSRTFIHATNAAVEQLRKDGYIEKARPNKRGLWIRTQKPYIPTNY